jgi:hypothetical protein
MRFAMVEMKLLIAKILSKFELRKCDQTPVSFLVKLVFSHIISI